MWTIWIEMSDLTFNNTRWDDTKTKSTMWQKLLEYGKITWEVACKDVNRVLSIMMQSRMVTKFGELKNFSTTKMALTPCIGTLEHLTWLGQSCILLQVMECSTFIGCT